MKAKIVKLEIKDNDTAYPMRILDTYLLLNPDKTKLAELKHMIEHRFDMDGLTDEEIEAREEFCDFIWGKVDKFITDNFIVLNIDKTYEISY